MLCMDVAVACLVLVHGRNCNGRVWRGCNLVHNRSWRWGCLGHQPAHRKLEWLPGLHRSRQVRGPWLRLETRGWRNMYLGGNVRSRIEGNNLLWGRCRPRSCWLYRLRLLLHDGWCAHWRSGRSGSWRGCWKTCFMRARDASDTVCADSGMHSFGKLQHDSMIVDRQDTAEQSTNCHDALPDAQFADHVRMATLMLALRPRDQQIPRRRKTAKKHQYRKHCASPRFVRPRRASPDAR